MPIVGERRRGADPVRRSRTPTPAAAAPDRPDRPPEGDSEDGFGTTAEVHGELATDRTVILITYRLGSTQHADRIIVLDHGRILKEGTHNTLLTTGGEYAAMWTTQASAYTPAPALLGSTFECAMVARYAQ
ncbi:hypothetical protein [Streptomyces sp. NPDC059256]|uniref:hypothetical protein n=1 Tax=Streptomyces sp. NPDC059256 TaxID=3346794 RepID=UPI003674DB97